MARIGIAPGYGVQDIVVGGGMSLDNTDPRSPILSVANAWQVYEAVFTKDDFTNSVPDSWHM